MKMPTLNIKGKLDAVNTSIKNFTLPSPAAVAEGIASGTAEHLKMPLASRVRTENEEVMFVYLQEKVIFQGFSFIR